MIAPRPFGAGPRAAKGQAASPRVLGHRPCWAAGVLLEDAGDIGGAPGRDPALVAEDRRSGKFSDEFLAKAYGAKPDG